MNPELISRLVSLVERTGDRVVLADPNTGKAVVVMDLSSYEKLCVGVKPALSQVEEPADLSSKPAVSEESVPVPQNEEPKAQKNAEIKEKKTIEAKPVIKPSAAAANPGSADLTQEELLDKINREIAAWKNGQEKKRADELKAAAKTAAPFSGIASVFEEEERFYLEPIE